jgi:hypothetical protein
MSAIAQSGLTKDATIAARPWCDRADGFAVELDLELAAPRLYHHAIGVSGQPERCRHRSALL